MTKTFSIQTVIKQGWDSFKTKPKFFILISLLYVVISAIPDIIGKMEKGIEGLAGDPVFIMLAAVIRIAAFVVGLIMPIGYTYILLRSADNQSVNIKDLFSTHRVFWKFILSGILVTLFVLLGFIALIIPGIWLSIALMFTSYVVVEDHLSPWNAIKRSYALTKGVRWKLLGFILVVALLNILGFIALGVGFLVTMPLSGLASVHLYKSLKHQESELISKPEMAPVETVHTSSEHTPNVA
ncbi:MAG: hypothetical protein COV34_03045 [Candidatus Zambryskibacteria bacterium CG10_big_fil_rev_8_21_14_0_10_42_12]|uniref:Glycerophosphoryl diester phosphodiesterase membrane domain-containing protein n=1 Tax=Candidatus Zambryskibacteria bacterium CG10_big_fil_rev_8_21_14_0_10_42_12 TaxID=1975115 RepID=A0A2H0QTU2_9BACT|nr:MAG: hypothetical protein COV34_03045 [Candidatus Zambryskibacteria bacterium CG10_big_fil_rev_8_21_14_0_10_42_12]